MIEALIKGFTLGLLLSIAVGPVLFSIIKQSINLGFKGGLAFVLGVSASDITLALISNAFSALFATLVSHKNLIGIVGSIFLCFMGIYFLFFKKVTVNTEGRPVAPKFRKRDYAKVFLSGFFMNILNPAVFLFWLTASTAVVSHSGEERIVLFLTCLLFVLAADIVKVVLAGKIRNRLTYHNIKLINKVNGVILICFSIVIIAGILFNKMP